MVPHALGTKGYDHWDRRYRWAKAGAVTLVAGNCLQAPAEMTNHQSVTPANTAIGATSISLTLGATAATADQYADGIAVIDTTPGEGYDYPIKTHLADAGGVAGFIVQLATGWSVQVALTAAGSKVNLYPSKYRGVIQSPVTTASGPTAGVAKYPIVATEYGWIGDQGDHATLVNGTPAIGALATSVGSTAGAAAIWSSTLPIIGSFVELGANGKVQAVRWTLS